MFVLSLYNYYYLYVYYHVTLTANSPVECAVERFKTIQDKTVLKGIFFLDHASENHDSVLVRTVHSPFSEESNPPIPSPTSVGPSPPYLGRGAGWPHLPSHKAALTGRGRLSTLRVNLSDAALKLSPNQL